MEDKVIEEEVNLFEDGDKSKVAPAIVEPVEDAKPSFEMPEKFKGKSIEDVVESYVNLEKEKGRKDNEVGELRKLTDQILMNEASKNQRVAEDEDINDDVSLDDFIDSPSVVVDRVLEKNPRLRKLEESLEANELEASRKELLSRHEDAQEVVLTPEFQKWANESPGRMRVLQEAHTSRDAGMAADLIDMYKTTRKAATESAIEERDAIAASDLKKASVEKGSVPANTKKIYRRSELIQLKIIDPHRYEKMSDEIKAAYAEGRVK